MAHQGERGDKKGRENEKGPLMLLRDLWSGRKGKVSESGEFTIITELPFNISFPLC